VRGHEFHFSSMQEGPADGPAAYEVLDQPGRREGFIRHNVLASYMHIHLGSNSRLAPRFVTACAPSKEP